MKAKTMTTDTARELLGFTTPRSPADLARLAKSCLRTMTANAPLRFKVACSVLIRDAA